MRNIFLRSALVLGGVFMVNGQSQLNMVEVQDNIYMLQGRGGNIGLCVGQDGIFMIDDQFADATPAILEEIKNISDKPVQFLVNTHHHGDHTGGNINMNKEGTIIFSHDNVRLRLEEFIRNGSGEKVDPSLLPIITFSEDLTFHYNGEQIHVFHVGNAHTDGDALVFFEESNVLHTGDVFFKNRYPYIDTNSGGDLFGYIRAMEEVMDRINENTKIIPGHGDLASFNDFRATLNMISIVTKRVSVHYSDKKTLEQVLAMSEITQQYDEKGYGDFYVTRDKFLTMVYAEVKKKYGEWR